jgi:hypothetical protein
MANTLNNFNLAAIAKDSIDYFGSSFFPVRAFAQNFSDEIAEKGDSVKTRIPSAIAAKDLSGGFAADDVTNNGVTVTLNKFKGTVFKLTDSEISKAGNAHWLKDQFMQPAMEATVGAFMGDAFALILAASYTNATVKTAVDFNADALADVGVSLSTRKVPKANRHLIAPPSYVGTLMKDLSVVDKGASGDTDPIKENRLLRLRGFDIHEYEGIPNNGESLGAIAQHPSAMGFAARPVTDPNTVMQGSGAQVVNIVEPKTGLPYQFRMWYERKDGAFYISVGFLYGMAVGQANALQRITTA